MRIFSIIVVMLFLSICLCGIARGDEIESVISRQEIEAEGWGLVDPRPIITDLTCYDLTRCWEMPQSRSKIHQPPTRWPTPTTLSS